VLPVIELFGLPGAGKTFLGQKLTTSLTEQRIHVLGCNDVAVQGLKNRDDGWITNLVKHLPAFLWSRVIHEDYCLQEFLTWVSKNTAYSQLIFTVLGSAGIPEKHCRSILGAIARTSVEYELLKHVHRTPAAAVLADEWFYHRFYTLFGNCCLSPSQQQILEYIQAAPASDCAVFVATPPDLCFERMNRRGRFPLFLADISAAEQRNVLQNAYTSFLDFVEVLKLQGRAVAVYDGIAENIEDITRYCLSCVESPNKIGQGLPAA
jgi:thymidylate kinase